MDEDITYMVRNCSKCQGATKMSSKQTNAPRPMPRQSWSRLLIHFAGPIEDTYYLIVADALPKWPEVFLVNPDTSGAIVALQLLFLQ